MSNKGFTIIEVLVAVAVISIGLMAMMAMQVSFISGTASARDMTSGLTIAESAVEQLRAEGTMWNNIEDELKSTRTPNLFRGVRTSEGQFVNLYGGFPVTNGLLRRAPGEARADQTLTRANEAINGKFCVDARMQFMANTSDQVIIGQVRVAWPNDKDAQWLGAPPEAPVACTEDGNLNNVIYVNGDLTTPRPEINVVHVPFAIRRHNY